MLTKEEFKELKKELKNKTITCIFCNRTDRINLTSYKDIVGGMWETFAGHNCTCGRMTELN